MYPPTRTATSAGTPDSEFARRVQDPSHRGRKRHASSRRTAGFARRLRRKPTSGRFQRVDARAVGVRYALHRLPDLTDRSILVLRFFVGLCLEDISEKLLLPLEKVRERYQVGLRFMERELGGYL